MKLRISIKPNIDSIKNICIYIFFIMTAIIFLYRYNSAMFNLRYGFMAIGTLLGLWSCLREKSKFHEPILLLGILLLCWVLCYLGQNGYLNYSFSNLLYTIIYIGLSIVLLNNKYSHLSAVLIFAFSAATVLLRIFQNVNMNHILLGNSRNFISVLLLLPLMFYYTSCHDKKKPIYVLPVILYFYISIYAVGRGGIVSAGFLTVALCIYKATHIENKTGRKIIWFFIFIIVITMVIYHSNLDTLVFNRFLSTNFSRFFLKGTTDITRLTVWEAFINNNKRSLGSFLLGSNTELARYDGNLHNSFLQAYASFGLVGFLVFVILIVRSAVQSIRQKDTLFVILLAGLTLRAFTDRVFFQGYCEIFLYYFIFYWDYKKCVTKVQVIPDTVIKNST